MTPVEVATRVVERLYKDSQSYPQDWNTDDTKTIGAWKEAIVQEVLAFQQVHQEELDRLDLQWKARS